MMTQILTKQMLDQLTVEAKQSDRRRKNLNFHPALNDPVQRLCNAMEPGTYVRPHRHIEPDKWEFFTILRGSVAVLEFDQSGLLTARTILEPDGQNWGIEIPPATWHTLISLKEKTVAFEIKPGPYTAVSDKDFAPWAPMEGAPSVVKFIDWFEHGAIGSKPPAL